MSYGSDGLPPVTRYSVLQAQLQAHESAKESDEVLGITRDGRVLTKLEFEKGSNKLSQYSGGWIPAGWFFKDSVVKDPVTGETFDTCVENMSRHLQQLQRQTPLSDRNIKPFLGAHFQATVNDVSALTAAIGRIPAYSKPSISAPALTEGDLNEFCSILTELQGISPAEVRQAAINIYWKAPAEVKQFCDNAKGLLSSNDQLRTELAALLRIHSQRDLPSAKAPLKLTNEPIPQTSLATQKATWENRSFETLTTPLHVEIKGFNKFNGKMKEADWTALEYEVDLSPESIEKTLTQNLSRASTQERTSGEMEAERFEEVKKGLNPLREIDKNGLFQSGSFPDNPKVTFASTWGVQNPKLTPYMEDYAASGKISCKMAGQWANVNFTAVLDGHTATTDQQLAERCAQRIAERLKVRLEEFNSESLTKTGLCAALNAAIVDLERMEFLTWGTTLNMTLEIGDHLICANVGDSRALLVKSDGSFIQLSEDAKPLQEEDFNDLKANPEKAKESVFNRVVHDRGGTVINVGRPDGSLVVKVAPPSGKKSSSLPMCRSIGDMYLKGVVSARPLITAIPLKDIPENSMVVQMSDGMTEPFSSEQIAQLAKENQQFGAAGVTSALRDAAFRYSPDKDGVDNIMVTAYTID